MVPDTWSFNMLITYTAKYTKLENGYMGQLLEWPEVITEGQTLEDCRFMLKDALEEMVGAYNQLKMEIPRANFPHHKHLPDKMTDTIASSILNVIEEANGVESSELTLFQYENSC
jgi:predicted RNase H-like HicB family nuclease